MRQIGLPAAVIAIAAMAHSAVAGETTYSAARIKSALEGAVVNGVQKGKAWSQSFSRGGETIYSDARGPSRGLWTIRGDKYCSQWPPSQTWSCWTVTGSKGTITFIPEGGGDAWHGRIDY